MKGIKKLKKVIQRLAEWLESKGFSKEEILECILYITK